jgi:hypothetical protein
MIAFLRFDFAAGANVVKRWGAVGGGGSYCGAIRADASHDSNQTRICCGGRPLHGIQSNHMVGNTIGESEFT